MINDQDQLILAVIRGILVTVVVFIMTRIYNKYLSKDSFLGKSWYGNEKLRIFLTEYYWLVGLAVFVINVLILYILDLT